MFANFRNQDRSYVTRRVLHLSAVLFLSLALLTIYNFVLHPWMMSWGSSEGERSMSLSGDDYPLDSGMYYNRAITVNAPASVVWQWLIQHGQDQDGFYSNTYLENLSGADIHNANVIKPEWQDRANGDKIPMARPDMLGGAVGDALFLEIKEFEPSRRFTTVDGNNLPVRWNLMPIDENSIRILEREMSNASVMGEGFAFWVWDPMHFVMDQRMLRGIKERAEGQPLVPEWLALIARIGWIAAGISVGAAFVSRRRWILFGLLCAILVIPSLSSTGDFDGALAGFLALGISLLGMLRFGWTWIISYPLVAAFVLLTLLLAPDSWTAFGLIFDCIGVFAAVYILRYRRHDAVSTQLGNAMNVA